ncbi:MAG TPA: ATP-dependent DNA ligase [Candidatus Dormibacteraeota bacterium]
MKFAQTAEAIGATTSTLAKTRTLAGYLKTLDPADLKLAATYMTGRPFGGADRRVLRLGWSSIGRVIERLSAQSSDELSQAYLRHSDLGDWTEDALGDGTTNSGATLREVAATFDAIEAAPTAEAKQAELEALLRRLSPLEAKYMVKVLAGDLRIGLQEGLVEAAIALAFEREPAAVRRLHMVTGDIGETAVKARAGELATAAVTLFQPLRFMLASPVETAEEAIRRSGADEVWTEEKYDGVRCQLHVAGGQVALFSRDLKETTAAFPEVTEAAESLGRELVVDGEILAHREGKVLRFFELQRRLGRKVVGEKLRAEVPVVLVAFDLLRLDGEDLLDHPLLERRQRLESLDLRHPFLLARREVARSAEDLDRIFAETRERGNEGLMVKDPDSGYTPGRRGMAWLKLKRPLATLDVVVTAVEWGHGKRRGVLSDYTFAVLDEASGKLVNVGKAYTGLTDAEIAEYTQRFLEMTTADYGRVRAVRPEVVLEVAFDSIQISNRHKSGFALRFPRIVRIRDDKPPGEVDTLARVRELYDRYFGGTTEVALATVAET